MTTQNVAYLWEHGPTRYTRLPGGTLDTADRIAGAARIRFRSGCGDSRSIGTVEPVAYLYGVHDPEAVVREVLDANPRLVAASTDHGLIQRFGGVNSRMQAAARDVLLGSASVQ